jgi:copper transport protein
MVRARGRSLFLRGVALDSLKLGLSFSRRRLPRAAAIALCLIVSSAYAPIGALLHATLLRSTPAANSHILQPPETIRLVFSEAIVPELSQISLIGSDGKARLLQVTTDPHDVHILVGRVGSIPAGEYKVPWRILSADGHTVGGSFSFFLQSGSPGTIATPGSTTGLIPRNSGVRADTSASPFTETSAEKQTTPLLAPILRGTGLGALMAGVGLLFFGVTAGERRKLMPRTVVVRLVAVGAALLVAHMIAWMYTVSPTGGLSESFSFSLFGSTPGKIEAARVSLALLALWAIALARRESLALIFGGACLLVSGAVGHPAAIHSYLSIPAKMAHLLSVSLWLGGLLWLVWLSRCDEIACRTEARRVSGAALISVIAIFLTGSLETVLFLNSPGDLIDSSYGRLVVAKAVGLAILVGFGMYNRFRLLPRIDESGAAGRLSRSVRTEIIVVTVVILLGGFLAYTSTPLKPPSSLSAFTGRPQ